MKKFFLAIVLTAALMIGISPTSASADSLDAYRQLLKSENYTIRYRNITPAARVTNKDRQELFGSSGMAVGRNDYLVNKTLVGLITCGRAMRISCSRVGRGEIASSITAKAKIKFAPTLETTWRSYSRAKATATRT